jgi:hypothetical protein
MAEPHLNGASAPGSQSDGGGRELTDPERVAEEWAERIGRWVLRTTARAREEAEDIWAEAQAVRREL